MPSPIVYAFTPSAPFYPDLGASPYLAQFYNRPKVSPHIPTVGLIEPSPPNTPTRSTRALNDDQDHWAPPRRPRRPSWHAGMSTPFLNASALTVPADYTHRRPRSVDNRYQQPNVADYHQNQQPEQTPEQQYVGPSSVPSDYPRTRPPSSDNRRQRPNVVDYDQNQLRTPEPWMVPGAPKYVGPSSATYELHLLLRHDSQAISLDLSSFEFRPVNAKGEPISSRILAEPATRPPITRLVVSSDQIPKWPVHLDYHAAISNTRSSSVLQPITLADILYAIHRTIQTQVTHREWAELDEDDQIAVEEAYKRRCKLALGHEARLVSEGVKRVDYLHKKVMFAGLVRECDGQGYANLKLLVKYR